MKTIGVDVGGTKVLAAVVSESGEIVQRQRRPTPRTGGPEQVLARGYSITTDAQTGNVLREAKAVEADQRLKTRLKSGEIFSRAEP